MIFETPRCTACGQLACGILEEVSGLAGLDVDEEGNAEYVGETAVDWNSQQSHVQDDGRVILECPNGHRWATNYK